MFKNVLALIGLYAVCRFSYTKFDKHLRKPMERVIADAIDEETERGTS